PADFTTRDVTFTLALTVDSSRTAGPGLYKDTLAFIETVGRTDYLVVNSGHSDALNSDAIYKSTFNNLGQSVRVWDRSRTFPDSTFLQNFTTVFWITDTSSTGIFAYSDIKALKDFLNKGNNLIMSSPYGLDELLSIDPAFVSDYLHLGLLANTGASFTLYGIAGNEVGDGVRFFLKTSSVFTGVHRLLAPVNGGREAFELNPDWGGGTVGISYYGAYKTLFLTFPVETIMDDKEPNFDTKATLLARIIKFTGGDITAVEDEGSSSTLPGEFTLYQNYPNPFNPTTTIKYTLSGWNPAGGAAYRTRLTVYNLLGREVKVLVDEVQPAGTYEVTWDATDKNGRTVATGVYFYKLEKGESNETRKMLLLK
ncbi:MAG: T9SS type A sorting domain-containing protein, partial [candidate division Zixibacteria bacterium]|nr:T9SS type A sorting domain-containing protein [candidate division Zixibacteria bacterium]